jgi:hypothetical protein
MTKELQEITLKVAGYLYLLNRGVTFEDIRLYFNMNILDLDKVLSYLIEINKIKQDNCILGLNLENMDEDILLLEDVI